MTSVQATSAYAAAVGAQVLVGRGDGTEGCHSTYMSVYMYLYHKRLQKRKHKDTNKQKPAAHIAS